MEQQLLVTCFESVHEIEMKEYLVGNKVHSDFYVAEDFTHLGCLVKDKHFLAVHFQYHPDHLVKSIDDGDDLSEFLRSSDVVLGLMVKRGNASVNSLLKAYGLEKEDAEKKPLDEIICCPGAQGLNQLNTTALMARMELYVPQ